MRILARHWIVAWPLLLAASVAGAQSSLWTWTVDGYPDEFPTRAAAEAFMRAQGPAQERFVPTRNSVQIDPYGANYFYAQLPPALDETTGMIRGGLLPPCADGALQLVEVASVNACEATTGNNEEIEADIAAPGLELTRAYNSFTGDGGALGVGWTHSYEARLIIGPDGLLSGLYRPDGKQDVVIEMEPGRWASTSLSGLVVKLVNGEYRVYHPGGKFEAYDLGGRLTRIDGHGGPTLLSYVDGRLTTVTGPWGHTIQFGYVGDRLVQVQDPAGNSVQYSYDANDNLIRVTNTDFSEREYFYEQSGLPHHLTGINHEEGVRFASFGYDGHGRLAFAERAGGTHRVNLEYLDEGTRVFDQNGVEQVLAFTSDGQSRRTLSHWRGNLLRSATFDVDNDPLRRMTSVSKDDGARVTTTFGYDRDHLTSVREASQFPEAREVTFGYLPGSDLPNRISEPRRTTEFFFDPMGNVITTQVTDEVSTPRATRTWTYTRDSFGRKRTEDGPRTDAPDVTIYDYYDCGHGHECGQLRSVTNALGHTTTYDNYDAYGLPIRITDPNGIVTRIQYDARQRVVARTFASESPTPETTLYEYWQTGLLAKVTNPDGTSLQYEYDGALRLVTIADNAGNRIDYTVDQLGKRVADNTYDPDQLVTRMHTRVFDQLGQLAKDIGAAGTEQVSTNYLRNASGDVVSVEAPLARVRQFLPDPLGRIFQTIDPQWKVTRYTFDDADNVLTITDPRNVFTRYTYNGFDQPATRQSPDTGLSANTYDSGGNLKTARDGRNATATYTYDALNRVRTAAYSGGASDPTITYTYDMGPNNRGRLTSTGDSTHTTSWGYDLKGRVTFKGQSVGSVSKSLSYTYDPAGRLATMTLPSGQTVNYGYGPDGRLWGLRLGNAGPPLLSEIRYAPFGEITGWRWGDGFEARREYDTDGRIAGVDDVWQVGLLYDDASRVEHVFGGQPWDLQYDQLDRLTSFKAGSNPATRYFYDDSGNRTRTEAQGSVNTYNIQPASNRLVNISGSSPRSYGYDAAGNAMFMGSTIIGVGARGLVKNFSSSSTSTWAYLYNSLGQRIKKSTNSSNGIVFLYDEAGHLVGEYTLTGGLIEETVWMGDIPVATIRPKTGGFELFFVHTDHLNAPRRITRPGTSQVVWHFDPAAFGFGAPGGTNGFTYNLRSAGQYFDAESSYYMSYSRLYDPYVGRYLQPDPIDSKDGNNPYAYADNNPLTVVDPPCREKCAR